MTIKSNLFILLTAASCLVTNIGLAEAQSRKCGGFGFWRVGDTCVNNAGKVCTVTGMVAGKTQLQCK